MEVDYDGNWKPFDESYANLLTNLESKLQYQIGHYEKQNQSSGN